MVRWPQPERKSYSDCGVGPFFIISNTLEPVNVATERQTADPFDTVLT